MVVVSSAKVGETVTVTFMIFDSDDALTDPDGYNDATPTYPTITIRKGETKFVDAIVDDVDMATRETLGTFVYKWDTAGQRPGPYTITARSVVDGDVRTPQQNFTLYSPGT